MADLSVSHLTHSYGELIALSDVSFTAKAGELTCLVGPSGCGKTTVLRLIAGLERLQAGEILLGDQLLDRLAIQQRGIGFMFQQPSLFPHMTIEKNITFGLYGQAVEKQKQRCDELLRLIGLTERKTAYPHQLSGGQQQRVALARALAPKPKAMLLDEPFANLDHSLRQTLLTEVTDLLKAIDIPIIMVTHDPQEISEKADHIVMLTAQGTIQLTDSQEIKTVR